MPGFANGELVLAIQEKTDFFMATLSVKFLPGMLFSVVFNIRAVHYFRFR